MRVSRRAASVSSSVRRLAFFGDRRGCGGASSGCREAEDLVLAGGRGFEREQRLVRDAAVGERGERSALRAPRTDRRQTSPTLASCARSSRSQPAAASASRRRAERAARSGAPAPPGPRRHRAARPRSALRAAPRPRLRVRQLVTATHDENAARRFSRGPGAARCAALRRPLDAAVPAHAKAAGPARLDAVPVEHPQQARPSMSNHDPRQDRRPQAGRGRVGWDATRPGDPGRHQYQPLAAGRTPGAARRNAMCHESVTICFGSAQNKQRCRVRSARCDRCRAVDATTLC